VQSATQTLPLAASNPHKRAPLDATRRLAPPTAIPACPPADHHHIAWANQAFGVGPVGGGPVRAVNPAARRSIVRTTATNGPAPERSCSISRRQQPRYPGRPEPPGALRPAEQFRLLLAPAPQNQLDLGCSRVRHRFVLRLRAAAPSALGSSTTGGPGAAGGGLPSAAHHVPAAASQAEPSCPRARLTSARPLKPTHERPLPVDHARRRCAKRFCLIADRRGRLSHRYTRYLR